MIIGLSGFARSGKDTFAERLIEDHGFIRIAFADKLRDFLYALNPIVAIEGEPYEAGLSLVGVQDVIDGYTWGSYKETQYGTEIRRLLQRLGTEAGRQTLWDTIWIDAALKDLDEDKNYVISDMRFKNEKESIESLGGITVRINRLGVGPANDHASETEMTSESFDFTVENDGTLAEFREKVEKFANELMLNSEGGDLPLGKVR